MFEQKGTPYRRSFGGSVLMIAVILFFLIGMFIFCRMIHVQLTWKDFQIQFAASIYDAGAEDGYMKAGDTHEAVRICPDNAVLVLRMMQTGKAAKLGALRTPQNRIWIYFSNGTHGILSEYGANQTHVQFTGLDGETYQVYLGRCKFSNMVKLLSVEGGNFENEVWSD